MAFQLHDRKSIRYVGYDYKSSGFYFVTICVQDKKCIFGNIIDGKMFLNVLGQAAQLVWDNLPLHYAGIIMDEFIIMPNHVHGIISIGMDAVANPVGAGF